MSEPTISPSQNRYWTELYELKVHVNYLDIYVAKSETKNRTIDIFLAITSNSSICGWAIWNEYGFLWGIIIAASQLLNAVKQFLPYRTRLKNTNGALRELEELLVSMEMKWFDVAEGNLLEEDINKLQFEIRKKKMQILQKHFSTSMLPENKGYSKEADQRAQIYVQNYYGG